MKPPTLAAFAEMVGYPLTPWQAASLRLVARTTVIRASRQVGKSYSLALLALWWAFTKPDQQVTIVSAGETAAARLLRTVRDVAASPLLRGSTVDESASLLTLSNGSRVQSLPASERAIRGLSTDLLLVDEASMVSDAVLLGAAYPTTAARPDARIVLASSPWAMQGAFYRMWLAGNTPEQRVHGWHYRDATWITPAVIEHARNTLSPLRFRAEYEGEFVGREDAYFDPVTLLAATAGYTMLAPDQANGEAVVIGADWGRAYDRQALVALGFLDDYHRANEPALFVVYAETSQRSYPDQMAVVQGMVQPRRRTFTPIRSFYGNREDAPVFKDGPLTIVQDTRFLNVRPASMPPAPRQPGYSVVELVSEMNGVGFGVTEELQQRLRGQCRVTGVHTTQQSKESWMSRVRTWLGQGRLILPDDEELLRQLRGLSYEATASGGLTISASNPAIHDDLAMALALAASAVSPTVAVGEPGGEPPGTEWLETPAGRWIPANPRPRLSALRGTGSRLTTW